MRHRTALYPLVAAILLTVSVFAFVMSWRTEPSLAQDPTSQQQTIDAAANLFFTQTAQVQQQIAATQTAQAGLTATAAFENTVSARFGQFLTATSAIQATAIGATAQSVRSTAIAQYGVGPITSSSASRPLSLRVWGGVRLTRWPGRRIAKSSRSVAVSGCGSIHRTISTLNRACYRVTLMW